jgi:hypothetical protein
MLSTKSLTLCLYFFPPLSNAKKMKIPRWGKDKHEKAYFPKTENRYEQKTYGRINIHDHIRENVLRLNGSHGKY